MKTFLDQLDQIDPSNETNELFLILEVIQNWIPYFNECLKIQISLKLKICLESGQCSLALAHHLYEICKQTITSLNGIEASVQFLHCLHSISRKYILENKGEWFQQENCIITHRVLCHLLLYCDTNTDLPSPPDREIIDFLLDFVRQICNDQIKISFENDIPRKLNICITSLTRFSIRDYDLAGKNLHLTKL